MKSELRIGNKIDFASGDEIRQLAHDLTKAIRAGVPKDYFTLDTYIPVTVGDTVLYEVPLDSMVEIHRTSFSANGYDANNPMGTGGVLFLRDGSSLLQFLPQNSVLAPCVITEGTGAPVLAPGSTIVARVTQTLGAPLNVHLQFRRWNP